MIKPAPKRNKYNAKKIELYGIKFDSKKESVRYLFLKEEERQGKISNLKVHPKYPLNINGKKVAEYWPDFEYIDINGIKHVEDVKGCKRGCAWNLFRLKAKIFHVLYGIEVEVV